MVNSEFKSITYPGCFLLIGMICSENTYLFDHQSLINEEEVFLESLDLLENSESETCSIVFFRRRSDTFELFGGELHSSWSESVRTYIFQPQSLYVWVRGAVFTKIFFQHIFLSQRTIAWYASLKPSLQLIRFSLSIQFFYIVHILLLSWVVGRCSKFSYKT